jgi:hypothetical protein
LQKGENKREIWTKRHSQWTNGVLFIDGHGMVLADSCRNVLLPAAEFANFQRPAATLPRSPRIHVELLRACKDRPAH